jgi:hyaluronan synthase
MTQPASAGQRRHLDLDGHPRSGYYMDRQVAGLRVLSALGADDLVGGRNASAVHPLPVRPDRDNRRNDRRHSRRGAAVLQARQEPAGSLARDYAIPEIIFKPRRWLALLPVLVITAGSYYLHDTGSLQRIIADRTLLATWLTTLAFIVIQLVLAWWQKPVKVNARQQALLDRLRVTVVIPCYNEDPQILDRTIVSLFRQTRLPDHIEVVDDGSTVDYSPVRDYWLAEPMPGVRFTWVRQRNAGKKHAQAVTFTSDHDADIFVTIDSDSALDRRAINEGLKPFADQRVVSVAGLETAINIDRNLLTRAIGHRSLVFQLFAMSAQSVARGSVLINPGAFSLYRAPLIRKIVPSYLGETFFGVPVTLGDDTALTLYALLHGRAVHQPSAVSLPVYPETLEHHLRQWTRWMRASTIRMLWRLRYLPVLSYGWIFTVYTIASFLLSVAISIAIPLVWPASEKLLLASIAAMVIWPLAISLRLATVRRSDQGLLSRLFGIALLPVAALWYVLVLRQIRFYGIATCWRQNWVTRQHVEVRLDGSHEPVSRNAPPADAAGPGHPVPHVSFYEGHAGDPRRGRDPQFRGSEVVHDPQLLRERGDARYSPAFRDRGAPGRRVASSGGDGQNVRPLPRWAGDVPAARLRPAGPRAGRRDQQPVHPQAGRGELYANGAPGRGRGNGFDPRGYQNQRPPADTPDRRAGQDRIARDPRVVDPRARGSQPPRDPRSSIPRPALQQGRSAYDRRLASGAEHDPGRYVPGSRDNRQPGDGYGAPRGLSAQDQSLGPGRRRPAAPQHMPGEPRSEPAYPQPGPDPRRLRDTQFGRNGQSQAQPRFARNQLPAQNQGNPRSPSDVDQDWAALRQWAGQDAHDYDGGYTEEYRQ